MWRETVAFLVSVYAACGFVSSDPYTPCLDQSFYVGTDTRAIEPASSIHEALCIVMRARIEEMQFT